MTEGEYMAAATLKVDPAHTLAAHVIGTDLLDVPVASQTATRRDVLDTFGAMLGGSSAPGIEELAAVTGRWGGKKEATLAVLGEKLPSHHTAMVNSAMGHALDFDDTYDKGGHVHPGTSVLAAALAVSEAFGGVTGDRLILAVTLGLDVSCRLGLAAYDDRGWHRTGAFGIFGATAAAGKLIGLTQEQMVHAFGIAYSQSAGNRQCIIDGALTKRFQAGQAAHGAVLSVFLAKEGFTGAENVFAGQYGFFPMYQEGVYDLSEITKGLGDEFLGDRISLKPYPCGRPTHSYIDAAIKLHHELQLHGTSIGCALVLGKVGIDQINIFDDPKVLATASIVQAESKHGMPKGQAEITVTCENGTSASVILEAPSGSPNNPLSTKQLEEKFRDCAAHSLKPVDSSSVSQIISLIAEPQFMKDSRELMRLSIPAA